MSVGVLIGQDRSPSSEEKALIHSEMQRYERQFAPQGVQSVASGWLDVTYYRLDLRVSTSPQFVSGKVRIVGTTLENNPQFLILDLMNTMHIDSVMIDGRQLAFAQQAESFSVQLDSSYHAGDLLTIDVVYAGLPVPTGFGGFEFGEHAGVPWVWSLSEPYGARDWWPCKDHPSDKADSADIIVTVDSGFKVGSNGKLLSITNNHDGSVSYHWHEGYPISTYLISVAITNYSQFSNWFRYTQIDSLEVLNYVLPEHLADAQVNLLVALDGLRIFSDLFGMYPFVKEKYGHSEFQFGGMEHETMTSLGDFSEETVIHELAHQWFGDMITCRTWPELWLNEGFATYCTGLYLERKYGPASYWSYMDAELSSARQAIGSVRSRDTSSVAALFNAPRVYSKGASVLHMLRHVLGDSVFFQSLHNYAGDSSLRYGTASTEEFRQVCEATSGQNLAYFFDEWIDGENFPRYAYQWTSRDTAGGQIVSLDVSQSTGTSNPVFFTMPIDVRLRESSGVDTTITVLDGALTERFSFFLHDRLDTLQLDPDNWILKDAVAISSSIGSMFLLNQNYPNPFTTSTTILYQIPTRTSVRLSIYNVLGQRIETLVDGVQVPNKYRVLWEPADLPGGVYFYRLETSSVVETRASILIR